MPGDALPISRHLAEEMRTPGNHVLAEQVPNWGDNARMCEDVINAAITKMRGADGITVPAGGQRTR